MKWKCLLVRAMWGCGGVAGGTEGLLCCPGSHGALTMCHSSRGTGMLVMVWKLSWHRVTPHWKADLTLPLEGAVGGCPALQTPTTVYYSLIRSRFYDTRW